ncbi:hypothetical protein A2F76_002216 [Escherichia coli]|nr:hypothetical protein [Escherichia coli]
MYVFELIKPGSNLKFENRELEWTFNNLLSHLETAFYDANVALNLFEQERTKNNSKFDNISQTWQADVQKRQALEMLVCKEFGYQPYEYSEQVFSEVELRLKREKWNNGEYPLAHQHRLIFLHAKSFLYALDAIDKFLKVISKENGAPENIKKLHEQLSKDFPDLRKVRNSAQHMEDRVRGLGAEKEPKPIKLKPVNNIHVVAPQGALMLNNLFGTKFGCTMADGYYGEVDISTESLAKLQNLIQKVFNSFSWEGPKQHLPR